MFDRVASGLEKSGKFGNFFKVRELSGKFENWSVKNKNPQKSGKNNFKGHIFFYYFYWLWQSSCFKFFIDKYC